MIANRVGRDGIVLALGGGVIGDLAGFVAACYQRGVDLIQMPTTLLAYVDSSVGGKTAVNHPGGKNMIGAFHQPRAVIADTDLLATLPDRGVARRTGRGRQVRPDLRSGLLRLDRGQHRRAAGALAEALGTRSIVPARSRREIVGRDEREQGERALLNLGHTFGHAIESATGYATGSTAKRSAPAC